MYSGIFLAVDELGVRINLIPIIIIPFGFILADTNRAGRGRAGPVGRSADVAG